LSEFEKIKTVVIDHEGVTYRVSLEVDYDALITALLPRAILIGTATSVGYGARLRILSKGVLE
jgi:hypothetical protein